MERKNYIENICFADEKTLAAVGCFTIKRNILSDLSGMIKRNDSRLLNIIDAEFNDEAKCEVSKKFYDLLGQTEFTMDDKMTITLKDINLRHGENRYNIHLDGKNIDYDLTLTHFSLLCIEKYLITVAYDNVEKVYSVSDKGLIKVTETYSRQDDTYEFTRYTRQYKKSGVNFSLTSGYDGTHDRLQIIIDYPYDVAKTLKSNSSNTLGQCVLAPDVEEKIKECFFNIELPIESEDDLASVLWLAIPKGCLLSKCPRISIRMGKEYYEDDYVGDKYLYFNATDDILYEYGDRKVFKVENLTSSIEREQKVTASINNDVDLSLPESDFWNEVIDKEAKKPKKKDK